MKLHPLASRVAQGDSIHDKMPDFAFAPAVWSNVMLSVESSVKSCSFFRHWGGRERGAIFQKIRSWGETLPRLDSVYSFLLLVRGKSAIFLINAQAWSWCPSWSLLVMMLGMMRLNHNQVLMIVMIVMTFYDSNDDDTCKSAPSAIPVWLKTILSWCTKYWEYKKPSSTNTNKCKRI